MSVPSRLFIFSSVFAAGCGTGNLLTMWELSTSKIEHIPNGVIFRKDEPYWKYEVRFEQPKEKD